MHDGIARCRLQGLSSDDSRGGSRFGLAIRLVAHAAVVATLFVSGLCVCRVQEAMPVGYLDSLPVLATLGLTDRFERPGFSVKTDWRPLGGDFARKSWPYRDPQVTEGCEVVLAGAVVATGLESLPTCVGVRVRRDEAQRTWILQAPSKESYAIDEHGHARTLVFSRPPLAWLVSLGAGALLALALLVFAYSIQRRAHAWRAARPGEHRGDGWVAFEDGTPPTHLAAAVSLPLGFVLVLEPSRLTPSYREHGRVDGGTRLAGGSLDNMLDVAGTRATRLYVFASLVALLALAPMLAVGLQGLVP
jgi:hypothetical protein